MFLRRDLFSSLLDIYIYIYFEIIRALCKYILVEKKRNNLIRIFNKRFNIKKVSKNVNI